MLNIELFSKEKKESYKLESSGVLIPLLMAGTRKEPPEWVPAAWVPVLHLGQQTPHRRFGYSKCRWGELLLYANP
jgi:hypothetical protein